MASIVFRYQTAGGGEAGLQVTINGKKQALFSLSGAKA